MCCQCVVNVSVLSFYLSLILFLLCVCVFLDLGYINPNMNRVKLIVRGEDIDGERRIRNRNSTGSSDDKDFAIDVGGGAHQTPKKEHFETKTRGGDLKQTRWRARRH